MASSRRTSPAQGNRQTKWMRQQLEDSDTTRTNNQDPGRETGRRRVISDITRGHLEQVINMMIPLSTYSTLDPIESAPANSTVTQPSDRDSEEQEPTQTLKQKERQLLNKQ